MVDFVKGSSVTVIGMESTRERCGLSASVGITLGQELLVLAYDGSDDTYRLSNGAWYAAVDLEETTQSDENPLLTVDDVANGDIVRVISTKYTHKDYGHDEGVEVGATFVVTELDTYDNSVTDIHGCWYRAEDLEVVDHYVGLKIDEVELDNEVTVVSVDRSAITFDTNENLIGTTFYVKDIDHEDLSVFSGDDWFYITEVELATDIDEEYFDSELEEMSAVPICGAVMPTVEYNYLITRDSVTLSADGDSEVVTSDHTNFGQIRTLVVAGAYEEAMSLMNVSIGINSWGQGALQIKEGTIAYGGMLLTGKLVDRIIDQMCSGDTAFERFAKFLNLTMEQESFKTRERLMDFAAHDKLDLNEDGYVVAFKNVRDDFMDRHSGTFDNNIGMSPSMRRSDVDDNHDNQCSNGLHVCSPEYLKDFWGTKGRTMRVVVDPRDFVAIPYDYNDSKARVCKYTVVEDVTDNISTYLS